MGPGDDDGACDGADNDVDYGASDGASDGACDGCRNPLGNRGIDASSLDPHGKRPGSYPGTRTFQIRLSTDRPKDVKMSLRHNHKNKNDPLHSPIANLAIVAEKRMLESLQSSSRQSHCTFEETTKACFRYLDSEFQAHVIEMYQFHRHCLPESFLPHTHCPQETLLQQPPYQLQPPQYPGDTKNPQDQALGPRYRHYPAPYIDGLPGQRYPNFERSQESGSFQRPEDYMIKHERRHGSHYGSSQENTSLQRVPEAPVKRDPLNMSGLPVPYEGPHFQPTPSPNDLPVIYRLQSGNKKKKASRATQACNQCRAAKSKCDDEKPCSKCQETGSVCIYKIKETNQDKHEKLLSKIEINTENGPEILQRLKDIEKALKIRPAAAAVQQWDDDFVEKDVLKTTPKHSSSTTGDNASEWSENEEADDDEDDEGWEDLPRTGSRIPEYHTSPISRIVLWKSVKNVIGDVDPDYTLVAEENRGVLRPYSMGGESDYASDTASHTLGGQFGGGGMRSLTADSRISLPNNHQGIKGALKLGLESSTVYRLLNIYKRYIGIKCPLFFDYELDSLVEGFLKSIDAASSMSKDEIGRQQLKRKRSDDRVGSSNNTSSCSEVPQGSAEHAIVLVILALGEVCGHKESVNFPQKGSSGGPIHFQRGYPSPEEIDQPMASGHSSAEEDVPQTVRSLAVTPGLTYFTAATDIVGKHFGSNTLRYVQLNILSSFYLGQLTRVSQGQAYLHEATRALRVISRSKSTQFRKLVEEQKMGQEEDNPLLFAFWTCFQLESKIITELQLPHSGILSWAQHMPWPNGPAAIKAGMSKLQVDSYMVRLMLRKHTNTVITDLYSPGREETYKFPLDPKVERQLYRSMEALETSLAQFPQLTSPETVDSTSLAMLSEQFNAEISFVQALTYRPCLKMVMNREIPIEQVPAKIIHSAKLCIMAIQNGMKAFEALKAGQSIISDVWDIAHTQWGNASILQVAFRDEFLKKFIDANILMVHVRQTAEFLRQVAQLSSALWQDLRFLEIIGMRTGFLR